MIRYLWLLLSLAAAVVFAAPLYEELPTILDWLIPATLKGAYINFLRLDPSAEFLGHLVSGALILTIAGFAVIAMVEGVMVAQTRQRLLRSEGEATARAPFNLPRFRDCFAAAPFLADIADLFANHLTHGASERRARKAAQQEHVKALVSSRGFFGPDALVDRRLFWWLFAPLPLVILGIGGLIAAMALVRVDDNGVLGAAPQAGAAAAALTALALFGATVIYAITRAFRYQRRAQAEHFSLLLDTLLDAGTAHNQSSGVPAAPEHMQEALQTTLKSFVSELEKHVTGHAKTIDQALKNAASAADKIEKSFSEATKTFSKTTKTQAAELSDALAAGVKALADFESKSRNDVATDMKELAAQLERTAAALVPLVEDITANQQALLEAIKSEASASKVIAAAAGDLNAAAKAGKETLEGFVTLAREMRDTSRALAQKQPPQPAPAPGKGFSDDLKKLRELAGDRKLPEL